MTTTNVGISIPTKQFLELVQFLQDEGSLRDPVAVVSDAIDYWIANASWKQEDLLPDSKKVRPIGDQSDGYWWKDLFLNNGTKIRMIYKGRTYLAEVSETGISYEDQTFSPSEFAKKITGTSRNAWRDLELQFPGSNSWKLADSFRR